MHEIDVYANSVLRKQLGGLGIRGQALNSITGNVVKQLRSAIKNWNDEDFRNPLLVIGSEEGRFYQPNGGMVNELVVVAIRNSYLEKASSVDFASVGLEGDITIDNMKSITAAAIEYFAKIDLQAVSSRMGKVQDLYRNTATKYPVAWQSLIELGKCTANDREHAYEPVHFDQPFIIDGLDKAASVQEITTQTESGINDDFNDTLSQVLNSIVRGEVHVFYTDSFKFLTRNFEKLLKVLELVLTHEAQFITSNYLISNGYVARRKNLVRAAHKDSEMDAKLPDLHFISQKYAQQLKEMTRIKRL
jgi:hypothetical protein